MQQNTDDENAWNVTLSRYADTEHNDLSPQELLALVTEEWKRDFNSIFIGKAKDRVGCLMITYKDAVAYVAYEDFVNSVWLCSYDLTACDAPDWDTMVRLTPDDSHEYSFIKASLIPKKQAWSILIDYITKGAVNGLYLTGTDGKPIV